MRVRPRILLIEDDAGRIAVFTKWLQDSDFVLVVVRSGGQALGMLAKGSTEAIAGILLDHDLSDSPYTQADLGLSTSDVLPAIKRQVRRTVPVLIHSHNANKPPLMQRSLESAGFSVTRIRFGALTEDRFREWLDDVRDVWESTESEP
jgi:CheY-like chemotaxis protein